MAKVSIGTHSAARVSLADRDRVRRFYRDVLGGEIIREGNNKDDIRLGGSFYIAFLYEQEDAVLPEDDFLKATFLELQADDVAETRRAIVAFGVKVLDVP